jgi:hypothetical protein
MKITERVRILEDAFIKMANDIKWIKRIGYFIAGSPYIIEVLKHIWK